MFLSQLVSGVREYITTKTESRNIVITSGNYVFIIHQIFGESSMCVA